MHFFHFLEEEEQNYWKDEKISITKSDVGLPQTRAQTPLWSCYTSAVFILLFVFFTGIRSSFWTDS